MNIRWATAIATAATMATPVAAQVANPTAAQTQAARDRKQCGDPWVTIALETVYGSVSDRTHCFVGLYNGGSWQSYDQLLTAVRRASYSFKLVRIEGGGPLAGKLALGVFSSGNLVAAGGGNLVAAGGGNLVAAGGGNLVAAGGGNLINQVGQMLVSPSGAAYGLKSGTPVRVIG